MTEVSPLPTPQPAPLFTLNLEGNGGVFAPTSPQQANAWLQREQDLWSWLNSRDHGAHEQGLRQALSQLNQALSHTQQAPQYKDSNPQQYQQLISEIENLARNVFTHRRLPHSSAPLAKRIETYRTDAGDRAASFFASVFVVPQQGTHFQPQDLLGWRGLTEGLIERFNLVHAPQKSRKQAAEQSFEQLRGRAEELVGEKTEAYEALHRDYILLAEKIRSVADEHAAEFAAMQTKRDSEFENQAAEHKREMENLRKTFREEIALRAPADYWEKKRLGHMRASGITGGLSFGSIIIAAVLLGWLSHDLLRTTATATPPEAWRVAVLLLIGVFAVWAVRLVVRMFLSHLHLSTDAAERVVMIRTYLSLLEGDRLASKEDRQLILQALFRPASDGIVKDEGIPLSLAELLTRTGKG
jgi:Family of unknown function (DUF6161)